MPQPRKKKKGSFPIAFSFHGFENIFLKEVSVHKVEQSECSPGNRSQRRRILPTEKEDTSLHKDSVCRKITIYIFWRPHLKIIKGLINMRCYSKTSHHFIWQICENVVGISATQKRPHGLLGLMNFSQEGFPLETRKEKHSRIATSKVSWFKTKEERTFSLNRTLKRRLQSCKRLLGQLV